MSYHELAGDHYNNGKYAVRSGSYDTHSRHVGTLIESGGSILR